MKSTEVNLTRDEDLFPAIERIFSAHAKEEISVRFVGPDYDVTVVHKAGMSNVLFTLKTLHAVRTAKLEVAEKVGQDERTINEHKRSVALLGDEITKLENYLFEGANLIGL